MISFEHQEFFRRNGYVVVEGLFSAEEAALYREHFMRLRAAGNYPGDMVADTQLKAGGDPLKRFPRMINMHNWDDLSRQWLHDERLTQGIAALLEEEPAPVQTMLYFKPPGARGQALHQDNFYLKVRPGTCMAAWLTLDDSDEENGCMQVVPGSHTWDILCPQKADFTRSFTDVTVPLPDDQEVRPLVMKAGDVLFFNGSLVHGSFPNSTQDRFRRSLIAHFRPRASALNVDSQVCGVWVERDGTPVIEMQKQPAKKPAEALAMP